MRTLATITATALTLLAGCTTSRTADRARPSVSQVSIWRLPDQPDHGPDRPTDQPPGPLDRSDPTEVAVAQIVAGLADQGLDVVDLGVDTLRASSAAVTVRVAATHRAGAAGPPHTSVYELDLTRTADGSWQPAGFRQAH